MAILRQKLFIPERLPSLNDYINLERTNKYAAANLKKQLTAMVAMECKRQKLIPYTNPITLAFMWYEPNNKRDPDNIIFGKKFILDGLVIAGIIPNDTQTWIKGFNAERWLKVEPEKVGVEVSLQEGAAVQR